MYMEKHYILRCYSVTLLCFGLGHAAVEIKNSTQAMKYLIQFGYFTPTTMDPKLIHLIKNESMKDALLDFQSFGGLSKTGILDEDTLELMNIPRCGCLDRFYRSRKKRYGHFLETWRVDNLSYKIVSYPTKQLSKTQVDVEFRRAFDAWSVVMPIQFNKRQTGPVHIDISFLNGGYEDSMPFDGQLGVIVHNNYPGRGTVHFDDAETWTNGTSRGFNLFQVALHAIGHVLGLDHTMEENAVMRPFYKSYVPDFKLEPDDILGIQSMYGPKVTLDGFNDDANLRNDDFENSNLFLCMNPKIDCIFNSASDETFFFKGSNYYGMLKKGRILKGYPKLINQTWIGLPGSIDAAFTHKGNGHTYFFKDTKFWKYDGTTLLDEYPKKIVKGFVGIPNKIDAAMVWGEHDSLIYFFKGLNYWIYNTTATPPVASTYPKLISDLLGLSNNIDAVLQHTDTYVYVFKGNDFYKYSDISFGISNDNPPPPKPSAFHWFGCSSRNTNNNK